MTHDDEADASGGILMNSILRGAVFVSMLLSVAACDLFDDDNDSNPPQNPPPTLSSNADLSNLTLSGVILDQVFQASQTDYTATVGFLTDATTVTPTADDPAASVTVDGTAVTSGMASVLIALATGVNTITILVTAEDGTTKTYTVEITREAAGAFAEQAALEASNAGAGDSFGTAVAVLGDILVVGADSEDSTATGGGADNSAASAGAAYVFVRSGGVWTQEAFLKASDAAAGDEFGFSVAVGIDTVVIGAPGKASRTGAAYVFTRAGNIWTEQATLTASNAEANDSFGDSVAISVDTIVVGATGEDASANGGETDNSESGSGAAYVFTRSAGVWSQQARLKASNADRIDLFGNAIAIDGDTVVVGALGEDSDPSLGENDDSVTDSGAAYVFARNAGLWTQQAMLKGSGASANDQGGHSVAISGETILFGAPQPGTMGTGVAYVFTGPGGTWSEQAMLTASNAEPQDEFGWSVDVSGDAAVVGARREDGNGTGGEADNTATTAGAAYVFTRSAGAWTQQAYLKGSGASFGDAFGTAVAIDDDTVAAGAVGDSTGGTVYVFQ